MARILVIDDEADVRTTIGLALEKIGHTVEEAADGNQGLKRFAEERFDLVITDILMPEKEGIETIRELRAAHPDLRIIAISGGGRLNSTNFLEMVRKLGADEVLKKPFTLAQLRHVVETCLGRTDPARCA